VTLTAIQAFVLTRAIMGAIGSALSYDERWLASADFEDSLFALVRGFLRACGDASAPAPAE
jgi:hypothetical protein